MRATDAAEQGMALVLALMAVAFLVAVTVQLMTAVDRQVEASVNLRETVSLDAMVESGLDLALAALQGDMGENGHDGPHDSWSRFDAEKLAELAGGVSLEIEVADLAGRLQINALVPRAGRQEKGQGQLQEQQGTVEKQRLLWMRLLTSGAFAVEDEDQAAALLDALTDWLDTDDSTRDRGAESGYYQGLESPYVSRNGPVQRLEELLLIKGFTREILYGNEEVEGLDSYVSAQGDEGKINLNTAPAEILQVLGNGISEENVQELVDFRQEKENSEALASPEWYRQVSGFPDDIVLDKELITTSSGLFHIRVRAKRNDIERSGSGAVVRGKDRVQLLWWQVK